jgi:hypothetical protein
MCGHANENPAVCACAVDCYCKTHTCKGRTRRVPAYTFTVAYAGGERYAVTVADGDRHVVTAYAAAGSAHALGRELCGALAAELARARAEAT